MPFITEEINSVLPANEAGLLIVAPWPKAGVFAPETTEVNHTEVLLEIAGKIRQVRAELSVEPGAKITVHVVLEDGGKADFVRSHSAFLLSLARLGEVKFDKPTKRMIHAVLQKGVEIYLDLAGSIDIEREKARLEKELATIERGKQVAQAKLDNPQFAERAPVELVEAEKQKLLDYNTRLDRIREMLSSLS
jgi:valyl-tRNA synthetase